MSDDQDQRSCTNNNRTDETDEENPASVAEISGSNEFTKSLPSSSNIKVNPEDFRANDEVTTKVAEINVKRIKNEEHSNVEDSSGEEAWLGDLVFCNDLVLSNIFKNLEIKDLFSIRLVNRLWNLEATKLILVKNNLHRIEITNDTVTYWYAHNYNNTVTLEDFQNLVENSIIFPCNRFEVSDDPLSRRTKNFFRKNGHLLKSLKLGEPTPFRENHYNTITYDIILLAGKHMPNLEILEFVYSYIILLPSPAEINKAIQCATELKKLHTLELSWDFPSHLLPVLLKNAKRLKNIYLDREKMTHDYKIGLEKMLEVPGAIPRLQNIKLEFAPNLLDTFEKIVMQTPRFSVIQIVSACPDYEDVDLHRVGRILSAIFEECSESLTEIWNFNSLGHIPGLTIPVFPNLKRFQIYFWNQSEDFGPPMLPSGVNLADKCPNVKTVELYFGGDCYEIGPGRILPQDLWGPFLSVRHLQVKFGFLQCFVSDEWVTRLWSLFPNLISVTFSHLISDWALELFSRRDVRVAAETRYNGQ